MRDLRQASAIDCTFSYRLLRCLITSILICHGHLCLSSRVLLRFLAQLQGNGQGLPHEA